MHSKLNTAIGSLGEGLRVFLVTTPSTVLQDHSSQAPGLSFGQWVLGLRSGLGLTTGQGVVASLLG